jgi:hypothetical protein
MIAAERCVTGDEARKLILAGKAPEGLQVRGRLDLTNTGAVDLPRGLRCYHLDLRGSGVRALPEGLQVEYKLDLQDCRGLEALPAGLKVGSLVLRGCTALRALPEGLDVYFLDLQGCTRLGGWPRRAHIRIGRLNASSCHHSAAAGSWHAEDAPGGDARPPRGLGLPLLPAPAGGAVLHADAPPRSSGGKKPAPGTE